VTISSNWAAILYWLFRLEDEKKIPTLPIYVDSPMALEGLEF